MNVFDYCRAHDNYFWKWEEEAQVTALSGGSTIAYRPQLVEMIGVLAEQGLPPFGSILLAMAATNPTADDAVSHIRNTVSREIETIQREGLLENEYFGEALEFLQILQSLPSQYTQGKNRVILFQTLFADAHSKLNIPTSRGIAEYLKARTGGLQQLERTNPLREFVFRKDFRVMGLLLRTFPNTGAIIQAMGELPDMEEDPICLPETTGGEGGYKDFTEELIDIPQTFQVGALIKNIWAGFKIPIFNAHAGEQPIGGVSDLSNKGSFDKLLVSEFANDDLVFMNRIANNEALYMHREMPPVKDKLHRNIVIDISIKNWGTPKILAFASYVAIARHPRSPGECKGHVVGANWTPVACSNPGELINALQHTDAALHAGQGLEAFLMEHKKDKQLEIFYITTHDSLKHPAVQRLLAEHRHLFKYIITTQAGGEIDFYQFKNAAQHHIQTIKLPLQKLWARKKALPEPVLEIKPVIESHARILPLLLPAASNLKKQLLLGEDIYCIANQCLLRKKQQKLDKGWELLLSAVPMNGLYEIGMTAAGHILFLSFDLQRKELRISDLQTGGWASAPFPQWRSRPYSEFLFLDHFTYLLGNPDVLSLIPDFSAHTIHVQREQRNSELFIQGYARRQKEMQGIPAPWPGEQLLKNVSEVFISTDNHLYFNGHRLEIKNKAEFHLEFYSAAVRRKEKAKNLRSTNSFSFKDGSGIVVYPAGYACLTSSDASIAPIYIILQLGTSLAMATNSSFAGNAFFHNPAYGEVKIILHNAGPHKLKAIQIIMDHTGLSLAVAKYIVDGAPGVITNHITSAKAALLQEALERVEATALIEEQPGWAQKVIPPAHFYEENITKFIDHIGNHATGA
ncbi:MAG: hypothetical protein EOP49_15995 [Sphingobacteriales bacterium]|nr:MAG: hypothetical protein EOP49_15995 [Sphingobacteriales bacterium]